VDVGLALSFPGRFHRRYRFADAAPSIIELAESGMCVRQI
jgi:hypothetical protein